MQKRSFLVVTMFLVGMFLTGIYAQTITVSGSVTSKEMSDPLIGVHIPEHTRSLSGSLLGYKTIP